MLSVWEHLFLLLQLVTTSFSLGNWRIMVHRIRNSSAFASNHQNAGSDTQPRMFVCLVWNSSSAS